jgi:ligand-binding SRPBCC domain-containing protein
MPKIELKTKIHSSIDICFDLARSIDLHKISTEKTNEKAIAGRTKGLIELNEFVTWEAVHFGIKQKLTSIITEFDRPNFFIDEQLSGAFKSFRHVHSFIQVEDKVIMTDTFTFQSPMGIVGNIFNKFILTKYMTKLLNERNLVIKDFAENGKWKSIINL